MRNKDASGITIIEETVPVDKFGHAPYKDFNNEESDIIVLAYQPGIGKTYNILKFMENNPNSFYFTDRHKVIQDNTRKWNELNIEYAHWEGFSRKCGNDNFKSIVNRCNLIPSIACQHCTRRCSYRNQFNNRNRVFAPFEYLSTNYVLSDLPNIIFLDESKINVEEASFNPEEIIQWLELISNYSDMPREFIDYMRERNYDYFIYGGFEEIYGYYRDAQEDAFLNTRYDIVAQIGKIRPYNLGLYFRFAETYEDFERNSYYIPVWYYAFEIINRDTPVVLLDASFNKDWFKYMLECFNGEVGFNNEISVKIYYTNVSNHNTIIYNMKHDNNIASWVPKQSVQRYIMNWFPKHLKKIREIFGEENVGLITFKEVSELKNPKYFELSSNQYFGNLRSSNAFENKRVIIILGTYFGSKIHIFEHLEKIFDIHNREQIVEEEERRREYERDGLNEFFRPLNPDSLYNTILNPKRRRRFTDSDPVDFMGDRNHEDYDNYVLPVLWLQSGIWDSEMYQAFHRNRGLQKNRIIFAYCWFPPQILKEFKIESVNRNKNDEEKFWEKLEKEEIQNRLIESFIDDINLADRPNLMKTYLSEKYKMFGSENRDKIQEFINRYLEIKKMVKPPKK